MKTSESRKTDGGKGDAECSIGKELTLRHEKLEKIDLKKKDCYFCFFDRTRECNSCRNMSSFKERIFAHQVHYNGKSINL